MLVVTVACIFLALPWFIIGIISGIATLLFGALLALLAFAMLFQFPVTWFLNRITASSEEPETPSEEGPEDRLPF